MYVISPIGFHLNRMGNFWILFRDPIHCLCVLILFLITFLIHHMFISCSENYLYVKYFNLEPCVFPAWSQSLWIGRRIFLCLKIVFWKPLFRFSSLIFANEYCYFVSFTPVRLSMHDLPILYLRIELAFSQTRNKFEHSWQVRIHFVRIRIMHFQTSLDSDLDSG